MSKRLEGLMVRYLEQEMGKLDAKSVSKGQDTAVTQSAETAALLTFNGARLLEIRTAANGKREYVFLLDDYRRAAAKEPTRQEKHFARMLDQMGR